MLSYILTGDPKKPAIITKSEHSTPVWIQQRWEGGEYEKYIIHNGCGHCCTAMALNLNGVEIDLYEEFSLCRKMWGEPRREEPICEDNFASAAGICKVLHSFGIKAEAFGVKENETELARKRIDEALRSGKTIIFWSHPSEKLPNNPFSSGEHYILLVGYDEGGKILVANSSEKAATDKGVQLVDLDTVVLSLYEGSEPLDFTWGRYDLPHSGGYVIVG